ncbi:Uma2 family endonuclease [Streptomyces sp. AC602_WCS936]|uniref:Uma2 family endonuclease n=1 Tax=Streptomyces sp. AC602_WCS936 TaxID=2823685 RepID=UPI0035B1BE27
MPEAHFAGHGAWADLAGALMVVEVSSYDPDVDRRNRHEKPAAYGEAEIPLYLLIDRDTRTLTVHSSPDRALGGYRNARVTKFGETLALPDPVGIELDTEILKSYVR